MTPRTIALTSAIALGLTTSAGLAETSATALTDLNMRTGPGPMYQIVDVIPAEGRVEVAGCISSAEWCEVSNGTASGWAYAPYLRVDETDTLLKEAAESETVAVIEFNDDSEEAAIVGTGAGAVVGALVAGPIGAIVGGVMSAAAAGIAVDQEVTVYVRENPVDPVILDGEVVVGAQVPADVTVYDVPNSTEYAYLNVNGNTVLVDTESREIVHVLR